MFRVDGSPATRPRRLAEYHVAVDTWMLIFEVMQEFVGTSPFKVANDALFGVVDPSDMSPYALPLGISFVFVMVAFRTEVPYSSFLSYLISASVDLRCVAAN